MKLKAGNFYYSRRHKIHVFIESKYLSDHVSFNLILGAFNFKIAGIANKKHTLRKPLKGFDKEIKAFLAEELKLVLIENYANII